MKEQDIVTTVVKTVVQVQEMSGRASDGIGSSTRPLRDVEGFDSLSSLEAIVLLSEALRVALPKDYNPFISNEGNRALSISEAAVSLRTHIGSEAIEK